MINIFNNHYNGGALKEKNFKFQDKKGSETKDITQLLTERTKTFCNFSYTIKKFSKNKPGYFIKGLPYILKGFKIKETEHILKLSSLSRKGFDFFKEYTKNQKMNSLIFSHRNLTLSSHLDSDNKKIDENQTPLSLATSNKGEPNASNRFACEIGAGKDNNQSTSSLEGEVLAQPLLHQAQTQSHYFNLTVLNPQVSKGGRGVRWVSTSANRKQDVFRERKDNLSPSICLFIEADEKKKRVSELFQSVRRASSILDDGGVSMKRRNPEPVNRGFVANQPAIATRLFSKVMVGSPPALHGKVPTQALLLHTSASVPHIRQRREGSAHRRWEKARNTKKIDGGGEKAPLAFPPKVSPPHLRCESGRMQSVRSALEVGEGGEKETIQNLSHYKITASDLILVKNINEIRKTIDAKYSFDSFLSSSQIINYCFNKKKNAAVPLIDFNSLYKFLKYFFSSLSALISKPVYTVYPNKIYIRLFYFIIPNKSKFAFHQHFSQFPPKDSPHIHKQRQAAGTWVSSTEPSTILKNKKWKARPIYDERREGESPLNLRKNNYLLSNRLELDREPSNKKGFDPLSASTPYLLEDGDVEYSVLTSTSVISLLTAYSNHQRCEVRWLMEEKKKKKGGGGEKAQLKTNKEFNSFQLLKKREIPTMLSLNDRIFQFLVFNLEKLFKKEVEIEIKRIKYPYHDSNILSQILKKSSNRTTFRNMMKKIFYTAIVKNPTSLISKQEFSIIPSFLSGIKIRLAGRLTTQRIIPRFTNQSFQMGSLARGKVNYLETSRITHKNKRGAFSFTVTTSQFL